MHRVLSRILTSVVTAALLTSCGQATGVGSRDGEALLTVGTPDVQSSYGWVRGTIPLVIANTGRSTVSFSMCGAGLERSVDGSWQSQPGIVCPLDSRTDDIEIQPNSQYTVQFPVSTAGGTYRFKASMWANNKPLIRVTEAFRLGT